MRKLDLGAVCWVLSAFTDSTPPALPLTTHIEHIIARLG